ALYTAGDPEAAFQLLDDVFRRNDTDLLAGHLYTMWAWLTRRTEESAAVVRRFHALHPALAFGTDLAFVFRGEGREADADRLIRDWAAMAPENIVARVELTRIEARAGRLEDARARAHEAVEIHRDDDRALPDLFEALVATDQV